MEEAGGLLIAVENSILEVKVSCHIVC